MFKQTEIITLTREDGQSIKLILSIDNKDKIIDALYPIPVTDSKGYIELVNFLFVKNAWSIASEEQSNSRFNRLNKTDGE